MTDIPELTCDVYDAFPDDAQSCDAQFRDFGARTRFSGTITTLRAFEDNILVKEIVASDGTGKVLVIDAGGGTHGAMMGGNMAALAAKNNWSGAIIWGAVRDSAELATCDLGIKALGTNPRRSLKQGAGVRDVPVAFGGLVFQPGWHVVADEDGIVVLPPDLVK